MTLVVFSHLSADGNLDIGWWCKGCKHLFDQYHRSILSGWIAGEHDAIARLAPEGTWPPEYLEDRSLLARPREDLLRHVRECQGVKMMGPAMMAESQVEWMYNEW